MNICHITHYSEMYGANKSLLCLIDGLKKYNINSSVLVPKKGGLTCELKKRSITYRVVPFKRWASKSVLKAPLRLAVNLFVFPLLVWQISKWGIELIHTNSSITPIGALLAEVLALPHIWHIREFGDRDFGLRYDWGETLSKNLMSRAAATIAVSKAVRQHVLSDVDTPCRVVYNGVISGKRLEQLRKLPDDRSSCASPSYTFAIVGQIGPAKGQKQALRALHRLKQKGKSVHLLVAGSGTEEHVGSLRQLRRTLNLEDEVSFLGYVSDPFEVYRRADAVLMCSPHEAMGRVTAEAMAAARPVIGYNSDGTTELIDDEQNGLLYNGTTEHLAHCMSRLIDMPDWARLLGEKGQEKANREFTNEAYARQVYDVFCETVHE